MKNKNIIFIAILFLTAVVFSSCSLFQSLVNLSRMKFKLAGVDQVAVGGIPVGQRTTISQFGPQEILTLVNAISRNNLPITFQVNITAKNPNDGSGGYARTNDAIKSFPFRLTIDDKEVFRGDIAQPLVIPGTGEETSFPLAIQFDLLQMYQNKSYQDLLNVVLAISGKGNSKATVAVFAQPTITSALGDLQYPSEIKIVEQEFH
jgi:hypothetical protein